MRSVFRSLVAAVVDGVECDAVPVGALGRATAVRCPNQMGGLGVALCEGDGQIAGSGIPDRRDAVDRQCDLTSVREARVRGRVDDGDGVAGREGRRRGFRFAGDADDLDTRSGPRTVEDGENRGGDVGCHVREQRARIRQRRLAECADRRSRVVRLEDRLGILPGQRPCLGPVLAHADAVTPTGSVEHHDIVGCCVSG